MSMFPYQKMMLIPSSAPDPTTNEPVPFNNRDVLRVLGTREITVNTALEQLVRIRLLNCRICEKLIIGSQNSPRTIVEAQTTFFGLLRP